MPVTLDSRGEPSVEERLQRLLAVTDSGLAQLDVDELLGSLLERLVDVLEVDTAAVLLLDESGEELFARAARGIEDEVRQGFRVPVGHGFAGRIAAERRPVVLDRVDETTVANPVLREKGVRAMLGAPLLSEGSLLGVLHVGTRGERAFDEHDAELLQVVADRIAAGVRLRLREADRAAAAALQRSLVPQVPRRLGSLEFAARYVAAESGGIGGDWYDAFEVESGAIWVVTGDVTGHGLRAAIVMGRIRSTIRAYAVLERPPDDVLNLTDRKIQRFEGGQMATVALAVVPPPYEEVHLTLAGHPPPILAAPGREAELVAVAPGPPLGFGLSSGRSHPVETLPLEPGAVLAFYTDGLVEQRGEVLDVGLERLRAAVHAERPAAVCQHVMAEAMGDRRPEDDVALLVLRRRADDAG